MFIWHSMLLDAMSIYTCMQAIDAPMISLMCLILTDMYFHQDADVLDGMHAALY